MDILKEFFDRGQQYAKTSNSAHCFNRVTNEMLDKDKCKSCAFYSGILAKYKQCESCEKFKNYKVK